ncbi:MAG: radical SAM protein [Bacilli bacterium]
MQNRKLDQDRNLILWNNKYYVVNDFTYNLIEMFDNKFSIKEIKENTKLHKFKIKKLYKDIEKQMFSKDYYEDNLTLATPIRVQWKITNKCNLKCKHCYLGELDNKEMPYKQVTLIVDKIIASNVMEVTISGGECLIYENIEEVVLRLLANNINVYMFTNGLLLKKFIEKIDSKVKNKKALLFYVSVDGLKESHEKIRGKNTFTKAINNIKLVVDKGYTVITNTVINSINYDDIIDMIVLLKNQGVKDIQLSNLIIQGSASENLKISLKQQMALKEKLIKLYNKCPEYGLIYYSEVPDEDNLRKVYAISKDKDEYIGNDNWQCTAGVARATVDVDGKVYCCPFMKDSLIGDLTLEKLQKIWDNKKRYQFLEKISKENVNGVCLAVKQDNKGVFKND